MDLRGLDSEDVYKLMSAGLNNKQIEALDQYRKDSLSQQQAQNEMMNRFRTADDKLAREKFLAEQGEVKVGSPVNVGGKMVQMYHDKYGNVVRREVLGDAPERAANKKLIQTPDGKVMWVSPGDQIPDNSTYLSQGDRGQSINDQLTLSSLKGIVETGMDAKENAYSESERDAHMEMLNLNDKTSQYVKIPSKEVPGKLFGTNTIPPQYIKLPRQANQILALPGDKVIFFDEGMGKGLTVDGVKQFAKEKGYTPEQVLKYLGLSK